MVGKKEGVHNGCPLLQNNYSTGESSTTTLIYDNYVPLDYFRGEILYPDINRFLNNSLLNFTEPFNVDTGEIGTSKSRTGTVKKPQRWTEYKNMVFKYYPDNGRMFISGSLHKFYNDGKHNHDQFTQDKFKSALKALNDSFGITPDKVRITSLEWGVNIKTPIPVNTILDHCFFINHKRITQDFVDNRQAKYHLAVFDEYNVKLYNKSIQYQLNSEVLRIERKQKDFKKFADKQNIQPTLQGIINSGFKGMSTTLLNDWQRVLFVDPELTKHPKYLKYSNPKFWENKRKLKSGNQIIARHRKELKELNKSQGGNYHNQITQILTSKLNEMSNDVLTFSPFSYTRKSLTELN